MNLLGFKKSLIQMLQIALYMSSRGKSLFFPLEMNNSFFAAKNSELHL